MALKDLDDQGAWALIAEDFAIKNFLRQGCELMVIERLMDNKRDSVIALWAMGVERLLKVVTGMDDLSHGNPWPLWNGKRGHGIVALDNNLRERAKRGVDQGRANSDIRCLELIDAWSNSSQWDTLATILGDYAAAGRYHDLSTLNLTQRTQRANLIAPRDALSELHSKLCAFDLAPDITTLTQPEFDALTRLADQKLASILLDWWYTVTWLCVQGVFGQTAAHVASTLTPPQPLRYGLTIPRKVM